MKPTPNELLAEARRRIALEFLMERLYRLLVRRAARRRERQNRFTAAHLARLGLL